MLMKKKILIVPKHLIWFIFLCTVCIYDIFNCFNDAVKRNVYLLKNRYFFNIIDCYRDFLMSTIMRVP